MNGIAVIDIIFAALIVLFTIRCYLRGFIRELLLTAGVVLGLLASFLLYKNGAVFIRSRFMPDLKIIIISEILAFAAIFLVVFISMKILERIFRDIIQGVQLGGVDRILGIFFGLAEGIVVVCLFLFVMSVQPLFNAEQVFGESLFARILLPFIRGGAWNRAVNTAVLTAASRV
ncbi:MAG: CvpA family protein [Treponema sp.]|jgi:membrane protein required for colicin V production|nr:CvpA family protein [Treponema sp.]